MPPTVLLLVEDDPDDIELTVRAFRRQEIATETVVVRDGVEALDYLFGTGAYAGPKRPALPQLVLLDLKLPRIGGLEVLRRMRESELTQLLPVVVLTSSTETSDLERSYRLGANSYIRKPVDFNRFVDTARLLGKYWLGVNEPPPSLRVW